MTTMYSNGSSSGGYQPTSPGGAGEGSRGGNGADRAGMMVNHRLTAASLSKRNTNRYSVTALYSMAAEQDVEVEDDLARGEFAVLYIEVDAADGRIAVRPEGA